MIWTQHLVCFAPRESAGSLKLDLGHQTGLQVGDLHDASMLNVRLAHDV